jgi:hypothetical protein
MALRRRERALAVRYACSPVTKSHVDPDEVQKQIAAASERAAAAEQSARQEAARHAEAPVAPSARSRWRFGIERHETSEGDTLVIRCYPRKLAFQEDDDPFSLEPRGYLIASLGPAIVVLLSWVVDDWRFTLAASVALLVGLIYAHYARIVRIHITRLDHFVVYHRNPKRQIGLGPVSDLRMDAHGTVRLSMRCKWIRGGRGSASFGLAKLPRADWLTVQQFIAKHRLRGL